MKSIKNFFAVFLGILGALILAPFVAFFGLMMLGLAFGMSLIASGAITAFAHRAEAETVEGQATEAPVNEAPEADVNAEAQPA